MAEKRKIFITEEEYEKKKKAIYGQGRRAMSTMKRISVRYGGEAKK